MSEQNQGAGAPPADDRLKNLQSEFSRKTENLENNLKTISQQLEQLARATVKEPAQQDASHALNEAHLTDPVRYAQIIRDQALSDMRREQEAVSRVQAKNQVTISNILNEFPEASQVGHKLYDKVQELFTKMPEEERNNSANWKATVLEAALDLGVKPRSKRTPTETDDFVMGSRSSGSPERTGKKDELDQRTVDFARLMGLPVDKPETMEKLKSYSNRDYRRYK